MKGLIIAPGLDNYLTINCLNQEKPDVVAFIITDKTVELLPEILKNLKYNPKEYKKFFIKDINHFSESIQEFLNAFYWLTEIKKVKNITVDATNVITTIGFSVYFVASFIEVFKDLIGEDVDIRLIFTTCDWKVVEANLLAAGEPIIGTEKIIELEDPMNAIGFILGIIACDFFNKGFYTQSEKIFKILEKDTIGEQNLLYSGLAILADSYNLWDKFDIENADEKLGKAIYTLKKVERFDFVNELIAKINPNLEILGEIKKGDRLEKIIDIFENANRKMEEGKFDDAIARYYRCLDMIAQNSLEKHGINTQTPDFSKLSQEVIEKYQKERGGNLPEKYKDGVGGIALKDSFLLLYCLDDSIGQDYRKIEAKFLGLLTSRNQSILAHGLKTIDQEKVEKFKNDIVKPFLIRLLERENLNLEQKLKKHQYPKLSANIKNLYLDLKRM